VLLLHRHDARGDRCAGPPVGRVRVLRQRRPRGHNFLLGAARRKAADLHAKAGVTLSPHGAPRFPAPLRPAPPVLPLARRGSSADGGTARPVGAPRESGLSPLSLSTPSCSKVDRLGKAVPSAAAAGSAGGLVLFRSWLCRRNRPCRSARGHDHASTQGDRQAHLDTRRSKTPTRPHLTVAHAGAACHRGVHANMGELQFFYWFNQDAWVETWVVLRAAALQAPSEQSSLRAAKPLAQHLCSQLSTTRTSRGAPQLRSIGSSSRRLAGLRVPPCVGRTRSEQLGKI
jgi:hypothetical protein